MPSAVLLSILIHVALFLLAGSLVIFTVVKKREVEFEPPHAVERPKMKLKKPKVKIKKTSRPKPTQRIVTKINRANMPDIQLPEMSGMGEGLVGDLGGFDTLPDFETITVFGSGQSIGNDFVGTFYDFKRDRSGRNIPMSWDNFLHELKEFVRDGWKDSSLARFYRSPKKLYATTFAIAPTLSMLAPAAFGEDDTLGYFWMAHYRGQLVYPEDITFRFRGNADDLLFVRVGGKMVLAGCIKTDGVDFSRDIAPRWQSHSPDSRKHFSLEVGDWITLKAGDPVDMEVMIGEVPGGVFQAMLMVEVQGVEYERDHHGNPILPIFKTAELSRDLHETIYANLIENMANLTNGPVFCDYVPKNGVDAGSPDVTGETVSGLASDLQDSAGHQSRTWALLDGRTVDAEFVAQIGNRVVLKNARAKIQKILFDQFSTEDREYIELAQPPSFNAEFSKQSNQRILEQSPYNPTIPPKILDYVFGATLKQTSAGDYKHELQVEFFAIGEEIDGDNYILLDHQKSSFTPSKENNRSHTFYGRKVTMMDWRLWDGATRHRGEKYGGYLIIVTDKRGQIIAHFSPYKWIFEKLENLKQVPVGKHFDKNCNRVFPPRPKRED